MIAIARLLGKIALLHIFIRLLGNGTNLYAKFTECHKTYSLEPWNQSLSNPLQSFLAGKKGRLYWCNPVQNLPHKM